MIEGELFVYICEEKKENYKSNWLITLPMAKAKKR